MPSLTVNLDLAAVLRSVRRAGEPDPTQLAVVAEIAGVDGIGVQMRRDHKYIRERDLYLLKGISKTRLTVEMPPTEETIQKVLEIKPWMVILAADHADSDTPLSPIDFEAAGTDFRALTNQLTGAGIQAGYFIEPEADSVKGASKAGAAVVLLNCSGYTRASSVEDAQRELDRIDKAANAASKSDLAVFCGRGINYKNVRPLLELGLVDEFLIGHSILSRGLLVGFDRAVIEMLQMLNQSKPAD